MAEDVLIVGAGPAGTRCATRCAERGLRVTLLGAEAELPYNRVALSLLLAGDRHEAELTTHDHDALAALGVAYRSGVRVQAIDPAARCVTAEGGETFGYRHLVLALGAQAFRLPLPGADLPGVLMYRTLAEVRGMLAAAEAGGAAVVIGGGLLGLEAAVGLARRGMRVTVVHAVDRLMERQLDAGAAALLAQRLEGQGIAIVLGGLSEAVEGDTRATGLRLKDGRVIPAELVVMAVGIRPDVALARAAGLAVGRAITVDDAMRTSDPAIQAIGECAEHAGQCIGLVAPALAQAEIAAAVLAGEDAAYLPETDATALKVAGAGVWSAGQIEAGDSEQIVYHDPEAGEYRRFLLHEGRLVGAMLYGETGDAPWYHGLIAAGAPVGPMRAKLPFGRAHAEGPHLEGVAA